MGRLTGRGIHPLTQALVAKLVLKVDMSIIALEEVMEGGDGLEMLMVEALAIGFCSVLPPKGQCLPVLIKDLERHLEKGGYTSISQVIERSLPYLAQEELLPATCTDWQRCVGIYPY